MSQSLQKNPYAAPQTTFEKPVPATGCRREGKILIVPKDAGLPHRCVKCNAPAQMESRKFAWHSWGYYLLILVNIILYAIVATLVQKRAKIEIGLCADHRARRTKWRIAAAVLLAGAIAALMAGLDDVEANAPYNGLAILGFVAAVTTAVIAGRCLTPVEITPSVARLKGCNEAFLASLPGR